MILNQCSPLGDVDNIRNFKKLWNLQKVKYYKIKWKKKLKEKSGEGKLLIQHMLDKKTNGQT